MNIPPGQRRPRFFASQFFSLHHPEERLSYFLRPARFLSFFIIPRYPPQPQQQRRRKAPRRYRYNFARPPNVAPAPQNPINTLPTLPHEIFLRVIQHSNSDDLRNLLQAVPARATVLAASLEQASQREHRISALCWAAHLGSIELAQILLDNGAGTDINTRMGRSGLTALIYGVESHSLGMVQSLLRAGADMNMKDSEGNSAFHAAVWTGIDALIKLFLDRGANINQQNYYGSTALHIATLRHRSHNPPEAMLLAIRLLVDNGADTAITNSQGQTALHLATSCSDIGVVRLLLRSGRGIMDVIDAQDSRGRTAISIAQRVGNLQVFELLRRYGADIGPLL